MILEQIETAEATKTRLWSHIFGIFDQHAPGQPARFICKDEYVLAREVATSKATVDATKLKAILFDAYGRDAANRLWNAITDSVRVFNQDKLTKLLENERLPALLVESALSPSTQTARRVRRKATKADREMLQLGEAKEEETEEATA